MTDFKILPWYIDFIQLDELEFHQPVTDQIQGLNTRSCIQKSFVAVSPMLQS